MFTNQVDRAILLADHNEYCIDGEFHPEFEVISTSYHNTHYINSSTFLKIFHFYYDQPSLFFKIATAKIDNVFKKGNSIFLIFGLLIALSFLRKIIQEKSFSFLSIGIILTFCVGVLSITSFFYGLPMAILLSSIILILGCIIKLRKIDSIDLLFLFFYFNFILLIVVIYGDERFLAACDSIWLIGCVYLVDTIFNHKKGLKTTSFLSS